MENLRNKIYCLTVTDNVEKVKTLIENIIR